MVMMFSLVWIMEANWCLAYPNLSYFLQSLHECQWDFFYVCAQKRTWIVQNPISCTVTFKLNSSTFDGHYYYLVEKVDDRFLKSLILLASSPDRPYVRYQVKNQQMRSQQTTFHSTWNRCLPPRCRCCCSCCCGPWSDDDRIDCTCSCCPGTGLKVRRQRRSGCWAPAAAARPRCPPRVTSTSSRWCLRIVKLDFKRWWINKALKAIVGNWWCQMDIFQNNSKRVKQQIQISFYRCCGGTDGCCCLPRSKQKACLLLLSPPDLSLHHPRRGPGWKHYSLCSGVARHQVRLGKKVMHEGWISDAEGYS